MVRTRTFLCITPVGGQCTRSVEGHTRSRVPGLNAALFRRQWQRWAAHRPPPMGRGVVLLPLGLERLSWKARLHALHAVAGVDSLLLLVYAEPGKQLKHVAERGSPRFKSIHVVVFVNCRGVGGLQILKSTRYRV